jgi:putative transposase
VINDLADIVKTQDAVVQTGYIADTRTGDIADSYKGGQEALVPWKETCAMEEKKEFILQWWSGTMSRSTLCELYGISRQTGYKWARRFAESRDWTSLEEQSRRPLSNFFSTPKRLVARIVQARKQFPRWGPVTLRAHLVRHEPWIPWPAPSTIGDILKRHGLVRPRRKRPRAPPKTRPFAVCREPNDLWCIDFKGHFEMGDGRICYPLTVMDAASRFLLACVAFHSPSLVNVQEVLYDLFRTYGLPKVIRSDNGEPFVCVTAVGGLTRLSVGWVKLGIRLERIDPGKPQQNGRHERMHGTLMEACSPPRHSLGRQQRAFDRFRRIYNEVRPHHSLEMATPADIYRPSPRQMPEEMPPLFYPFADAHRVKTNGAIRWDRRDIFISSALAGELVGVQHLDLRFSKVYFADILLGVIDRAHLEHGLQRPKVDRRRRRTTKVSAMSPV